jgi:hypothetical protein
LDVKRRRKLPLAFCHAGIGLSLIFAFPALGETSSGPLPGAFDKSRYAGLHTHSPFALATNAAATAAPQPSFAANWYVTGIGRIGGHYFVTIKSRDQTMSFSLYAEEPDRATGTMLAGVEWSDKTGKSKVKLSKGGEVATLEFNEAEVRSKPMPGGAAAGQVAAISSPGVPQQNVNLFPSAQAGVNARRPEPPPVSTAQGSAMTGGFPSPTMAGTTSGGGSMGGTWIPTPKAQTGNTTDVGAAAGANGSAAAFSPSPANTATSGIASTPAVSPSSPGSAPSSGSGSSGGTTGTSPDGGTPMVNLYPTAQSGVNALSPVPEVW